MLKPLLRTLPKLSGNVKIACTLTGYQKDEDSVFSAYVRYARLLPLSSVLSQRKIEANLLSSTYDFDLVKYYKSYSNYFYDYVYDYSKDDYIYLEKDNCQSNRDTDFEFGCKRVSYLKNDSQFAFYAPIYIESNKDIPDYFLINITLKNDKQSINKKIKILINGDIKYNYLYVYLNKYSKKLDSNVIYCTSNSKQATYYGIDLIRGGFNSVVDSIVSKALCFQNTINNFDAIFSSGFERNHLCIKQVIPLAFYFNISDILSDDEKKKFYNASSFINGAWFKNGEQLSFYDIDTDYNFYSEDPYLINKENGVFGYLSSNTNILDMHYPSLNECKYIGYRYSNKLLKTYNRWKMKYSSDSHPYISNLSSAFSYNQSSLYKYGQFPEKYKSINVISDSNNNVILPIGNGYKSKESPYYSNKNLVNNYYSIINNYVSTWYSLTDSLEDIYSKNIWSDVDDDKVYYKGILYDLSKIYQSYPDIDRIDKFSVIVKLNFNKVDQEQLSNIKRADTSIFISDKYKKDSSAWISQKIDDSLSVGDFDKLPMFYNTVSSFGNGNSELVFDKLYKESDSDKDGDFIDLLSLGYDVYEINKYYKYSNIVGLFSHTSVFKDAIEEVFSRVPDFSNFCIDGYELLPIYKLNSIKHENNRDIVFENKEGSDWILDSLHFSQHGNYYKTKYERTTLNSLIVEYPSDKMMIPLYLGDKFLSEESLKEVLYNIYGSSYTTYLDLFPLLEEYKYYPRVKDSSSSTYASDLFMKKDRAIGQNYGSVIPKDKLYYDIDLIYVDIYNLTNVINKYNKKYKTSYSISNYIDLPDEEKIPYGRIFFAKFLNQKHLLYYVSDLFKDDKAEGTLKELFDSLYIRKRVMINDTDNYDLTIKDQYIHISELYDNHVKLSQKDKIKIIEEGANFEIYEKVKDKYRKDTYILGDAAPRVLVGWRCEAFNVLHHWSKDPNDWQYECSIPGGPGHWEYESSHEFHSDDFYYIPTYYIQSYKGNNVEYTELFTFIRDNYEDDDQSLFDYITKDTVAMVRNGIDLDDLSQFDFENITFPIFKTSNTSNFEAIDKESELFKKKIRKTLHVIYNTLNKYKDSIFIKDHYTDQYSKFNNFRNINDYQFLDDESKLAILNKKVEILTYIIDENGKFIRKDYDSDNFYREIITDPENPFYDHDEYMNYMKETINRFLSDVVWHEDNNYFSMSDFYLKDHDLDNLVGIPDRNGEERSEFNFEIVFKKRFMKLNSEIFNFMNLEKDSKYPYKDLYLYRIYKPDEYPSSIRMYYTTDTSIKAECRDISDSLCPLFDDIFLQDKEYSVIYKEYNQANITTAQSSIGTVYRYNSPDVIYMYDISSLPYDKIYTNPNDNNINYATKEYKNYLSSIGKNPNAYYTLPTYDLLDSCYSNSYCISNDLGLYSDFSINTYTSSYQYTYSYTYIKPVIESVSYTDGNSSYNIVKYKEFKASEERISYNTYGFILIDANIDNTNSSFNIVDTEYKRKKYFTSINGNDIYNPNYNILDTFNYLVPFSRINLQESLYESSYIISIPSKYTFNTYYKQSELNDLQGNCYAYNIIKHNTSIDTITLQRYFDSMVPYIKETNTIDNAYCLKFKDYKYPSTVEYGEKDIFYSEPINIYKYNKNRVYHSDGTYSNISTLEYKHFNDNKFINLKEEFEIKVNGKHTYNEILTLEDEKVVIEAFKKELFRNKLLTYSESDILFLYNRYKIEYNSVCVGLNPLKTEKIYTLTYKFKLL